MFPFLANLSLHLPLVNLSLATHASHPCLVTCLPLQEAMLWPCVSLLAVVMEMLFLLYVLQEVAMVTSYLAMPFLLSPSKATCLSLFYLKATCLSLSLLKEAVMEMGSSP